MQMAPRQLIIDNYDSFTYNIDHYIASIPGCKTRVVKNDAITLSDIQALNPDCVILSPGPGHPGVARDFGVCRDVLDEYDAPILGICLGHQGLAHHFGCQVGRAPIPIMVKPARFSTTKALCSRAFHRGLRPCGITRLSSILNFRVT